MVKEKVSEASRSGLSLKMKQNVGSGGTLIKGTKTRPSHSLQAQHPKLINMSTKAIVTKNGPPNQAKSITSPSQVLAVQNSFFADGLASGPTTHQHDSHSQPQLPLPNTIVSAPLPTLASDTLMVDLPLSDPSNLSGQVIATDTKVQPHESSVLRSSLVSHVPVPSALSHRPPKLSRANMNPGVEKLRSAISGTLRGASVRRKRMVTPSQAKRKSDDLVLFSEASSHQATTILNIMDIFCAAFGQNISTWYDAASCRPWLGLDNMGFGTFWEIYH
ncbi:hypothetical protein LINGRAHAP2_LOCUS24135 [Linum grandiflorum]